jgi:hypothetical protein
MSRQVSRQIILYDTADIMAWEQTRYIHSRYDTMVGWLYRAHLDAFSSDIRIDLEILDDFVTTKAYPENQDGKGWKQWQDIQRAAAHSAASNPPYPR